MGSFCATARLEVRGIRCIASSVHCRWFDGIELKKSSGIGRLGRRPRPPTAFDHNQFNFRSRHQA